MRTNTKTILLALYNQDQAHPEAFPQEVIRPLVPMTDGGFRSLIHYLEKQRLIRTIRIGSSEIVITEQGRRALEAEFPALLSKWKQWEGSWNCLIFLEPPAGDKQFRRLRQLLLADQAVAISRGVYAYPGEFSATMQYELESMYAQSVTVAAVSAWRFGQDPILYSVTSKGNDLYSVYSGVSKELYEMLAKKNNKKGLIKSVINRLPSDFDLFRETIAADPGYFAHYFPDKIGGAEVLKLFQELLLSL